MSERRWGKWTRDGVPKDCACKTDAEVLAEMPTVAVLAEAEKRLRRFGWDGFNIGEPLRWLLGRIADGTVKESDDE